nr:MAG TPA: hypothetical protein [Caudoviricetes sp.]
MGRLLALQVGGNLTVSFNGRSKPCSAEVSKRNPLREPVLCRHPEGDFAIYKNVK